MLMFYLPWPPAHAFARPWLARARFGPVAHRLISIGPVGHRANSYRADYATSASDL
jgi:hypothetical protein